MIAKTRKHYFHLPHPGDGEPLPEAGDFTVVRKTGTTYYIESARCYRDSVEDFDIDDGEPAIRCRVLRYALMVRRVPEDERPEDAMTWWTVPLKRRKR